MTKKSIVLTVLAAVLIMEISTPASAQRITRSGTRDRNTTQDTRQPVNRQQNDQQQIQQAAQDLDATLVNFLEMVNLQQKPTPQDLDQSKAVVTAAKKYAKRFMDPLKCELFMLDAWNKFYDNDFTNASLTATQAYKADQTNNDARSTQAAFAIFADRKPHVPPAPKQRPAPRTSTSVQGRSDSGRSTTRRTPSSSRPQNTRTQPAPVASNFNMNASSGNILQFDPDAVDIDMLGKTVTPMKLACINSTSMDYNPALANLCIMFWQIESKNAPGEPNDATVRSRSTRPMQNNPYSRTPPQRGQDPRSGSRNMYDEYDRGGRGDYGRGDYGRGGNGMGNRQNGDPFASQMEAYGKIFQTRVINPQVKFVAINTNSLTETQAVVEKMVQNPWPWANVMAASPASGASQFADIDATTPKLAIVDRTGKIKYAGPAAGFLAPMVIDHLAGNTAPAPAMTSTLKNIFTSKKPTETRPTATPPQTNLNMSDQGTDEITPEDYEAGKKLEYAKAFVQMGRKPKLTSKLAVDTCREIIKDYPQSEYAQEARMLLRKVPEYERKRYKITDAEMGL